MWIYHSIKCQFPKQKSVVNTKTPRTYRKLSQRRISVTMINPAHKFVQTCGSFYYKKKCVNILLYSYESIARVLTSSSVIDAEYLWSANSCHYQCKNGASHHESIVICECAVEGPQISVILYNAKKVCVRRISHLFQRRKLTFYYAIWTLWAEVFAWEPWKNEFSWTSCHYTRQKISWALLCSENNLVLWIKHDTKSPSSTKKQTKFVNWQHEFGVLCFWIITIHFIAFGLSLSYQKLQNSHPAWIDVSNRCKARI